MQYNLQEHRMKQLIDKLKIQNKDTKNVIRNIINSVFIKGGGIIVGLLTTPAYMNYFKNQEVLGVWFTILSVITWMLNFDLGIGNGLRNRLVEEMTLRHDHNSVRKLISSSYIFLLGVSVLVGIIVTIGIRYVNWNNFFSISEELISVVELRTTVGIVILSILMQMVLRLVTSIEFALQKSYVANFLLLITNAAVLVFVLVANKSGRNNNAVALSIAYLLAVNVPLVVTTFLLFVGEMKRCRPSFRFFEMKCAVDTLKLGGLFLFIQLEAMLINNSSTLLITKLCGPSYVVEYNVYFKVFSMVNTFYALVTIPIWSAVTKAMAKKDYIWIKKTLRVLQLVALLFVVAQLLVMPIMQTVFDIWLGAKSFPVKYGIMMCFALEQLFMVWSNLNASICNGLNQLKSQLCFMTIGVLALFGFSIILTRLSDSYWMIVLAHCASLIPYCISQSIWLENYIKKHQGEIL